MESGGTGTGSPRSYLYVPGDQAERLEKAPGRGADALILDLEDAVAPQNKAAARELVGGWIQGHPEFAASVWVRITAEDPAADLEAITAPIAGVMVPRAETALLAEVDELLAARESRLGIPAASIAVIPLIETARGLLDAVQLASAPRTVRLAIGRADLAGELGLGIDPEGPEFRSILLQLVIASSAAGISAPVAPTSTDFRDLDGLRASTEQLLRLGYRGRTAVHPAQLSVINEAFTPAADEVQRAERLVAAFEEAERSGSGVTTDENGRMVDAAVVRSARDVLARARPARTTE
ncbi:CoA ester lyase [Leifsonia bigeumensis]|uniref:CoA ester lyase n=1 Tax=Leifsonella bigeumensis TaxID=433643 RepID=A0ABP7FFY2_9MICO